VRRSSLEGSIEPELGAPPEFDGVKCVECGKRFRTENDHVEPHVALGPASVRNLEPRCWPCHQAKTNATAGRASSHLRQTPTFNSTTNPRTRSVVPLKADYGEEGGGPWRNPLGVARSVIRMQADLAGRENLRFGATDCSEFRHHSVQPRNDCAEV
jgi:hypothetical protein